MLRILILSLLIITGCSESYKSAPQPSPTPAPSVSPSPEAPVPPRSNRRINFRALAGTPKNDADAQIMAKGFSNMADDVDFVIHLGDIGRGAEDDCDREMYQRAFTAMAFSPVPYYMTIGDNEWNDCKPWRVRRAKKLWEEYFGSSYFHFRYTNVVFIGIVLPGGRQSRSRHWVDSIPISIQYIDTHSAGARDTVVVFGEAGPTKDTRAHKKFFGQLKNLVINLPVKRFYYIHGDGAGADGTIKKLFGYPHLYSFGVPDGPVPTKLAFEDGVLVNE